MSHENGGNGGLTDGPELQTVNCDVLKPLFDLLVPPEQRKQFDPHPSDWVFDSPFRAIVNQLDTVYFRSRALPHQAYYQPSACAEFRGDTISTRAFFKHRRVLDVYNGFTIIFHLSFGDAWPNRISVPTLPVTNITISLRNSDIDLLKLGMYRIGEYWRLNFTYWLPPDHNASIILFHIPSSKNLTLNEGYTSMNYYPTKVWSRIFVLLVDGPDFQVDSKYWNWEYRRVRLLQDNGVMLAETRLYVPSRNYFRSFGRPPEAIGQNAMPFIANSLEVAANPVYSGYKAWRFTITSKVRDGV
ncbi:hypothetical protein SprV_0802589700 [Sparganum proliferum]